MNGGVNLNITGAINAGTDMGKLDLLAANRGAITFGMAGLGVFQQSFAPSIADQLAEQARCREQIEAVLKDLSERPAWMFTVGELAFLIQGMANHVPGPALLEAVTKIRDRVQRAMQPAPRNPFYAEPQAGSGNGV